MEYSQQIQGENLSLQLKGQMTFNDHPKIKEVIRIISSHPITLVTIDFSDIEFIDSAGLGMLLILKEEMDKKSGRVLLMNPKGQVEKIFRVSKFDSLFKAK
jgi:anti-anti-sigma factor